MERTLVASACLLTASLACNPSAPVEEAMEGTTGSTSESSGTPVEPTDEGSTTTAVADSSGGSTSSDGGSTSSDGGSGSSSDGGSTSSDGGSTSTGMNGCIDDAECAALDGPCAVGLCMMGVCQAQPLPDDTQCSNGDACQLNEVCTMGVCGGGMPVDCSALDGPCTIGACNPADGSCSADPANEGGACDDGTACTYDDICVVGVCAGTSGPLFEETFVDNSQGWTLQGKWEIDVATVSAPGSLSGATDPAVDHTATADEGLAGVLIGGLSGPPGHPPQYMTSPVIDLGVIDPVVSKELRFWRHMASTDVFMDETVDLWDGAAWVNVFSLAGTVQDLDWTELVIDISGYTNSDFQIRFGHTVNSALPVGPAEPSWSVDDVSVAPVCP
jgi:hypothetical protein